MCEFDTAQTYSIALQLDTVLVGVCGVYVLSLQ